MIEHKATSLLDGGQAKALLGLHFEEKLVDAMNNDQNLEKWKERSNTSVGYLYSLFADVMKALRVSADKVDYVYATSDIPKLPSGARLRLMYLLRLTCLMDQRWIIRLAAKGVRQTG